MRILVSGDTWFMDNQSETPITQVLTNGLVTDVIDATPEFEQVLANIRADESVVWVRELGFGMNRAFSKDRTVSDIGTLHVRDPFVARRQARQQR